MFGLICQVVFADSCQLRLPLVVSETQVSIVVDENPFAWNLLDLCIFALQFASSQTDDIVELRKVNFILRLGPVNGILKLNRLLPYSAVPKRVDIGFFEGGIVD